jgi:hypothetical protein
MVRRQEPSLVSAVFAPHGYRPIHGSAAFAEDKPVCWRRAKTIPRNFMKMRAITISVAQTILGIIRATFMGVQSCRRRARRTYV